MCIREIFPASKELDRTGCVKVRFYDFMIFYACLNLVGEWFYRRDHIIHIKKTILR